VEKDKQNTPSFSAEVMTGLARWKKPRERMIFVLCGAAGLRIGEVLGIEIDKHTAPDFLPSTSNKRFVTARWSNGSRLPTGFVRLIYTQRLPGFSNSSLATGRLVSSSVLERGDPSHPRTSSGVICIKALKELKYVDPFTGTHKAGNHAFRHFRNTYLRNYTECPEGLYKYWMGHAGKDMSDLYDKIKEDVAFRRKWAERCGFGFELPSVVPNVAKTAEALKAA
jgi:hypothetical protein